MHPLVDTAAPMAPEFVAVRSLREELHDTFTLEMQPPSGFSFEPGQFTMLYAFGVGEVPISISGDPGDRSVLVQTIRRVGAVTEALGSLTPSDLIGVRGPFGTPWPVDRAEGKDVVIVAGGIGLAPLRPVLYHVLAHRDRYNRVMLLYGSRSPSDLLYLDEVQEWRSRLDMTVMITVDSADGGWHGSVGVVTKLVNRAPFDGANTIAFVCGPSIMMRFTGQSLEAEGVTPDRIYVSMERNMKCGIGLCGHCQFGQYFVCKDGPVHSCGDSEELCWMKEV